MGEHEEQFVFEMGYDKGFKDGIKGSIPKDQYENRLKADMVAMLTDIQLEMESLRFGQPPRKYVVDECSDIIQQKIDVLKEIEPQESEDK